MMDKRTTLYPIYLNLRGQACLVVGGGEIAAAKIKNLMEAGAEITVSAPEVTSSISQWHEEKRIQWNPRDFEPSDLSSKFLVILATNDPEKNRQIAELAREKNCLYNTLDDPKFSNFILPAIARRGMVQAAVTTSGASPALGKLLRDQLLEQVLTPHAQALAEFLGKWRKKVKAALPTYLDRKNFWEEVLASGIPDILRDKGEANADENLLALLNASTRQTVLAENSAGKENP